MSLTDRLAARARCSSCRYNTHTHTHTHTHTQRQTHTDTWTTQDDDFPRERTVLHATVAQQRPFHIHYIHVHNRLDLKDGRHDRPSRRLAFLQ